MLSRREKFFSKESVDPIHLLIHLYIYISIIFVRIKIDRLIQKQDKCDCYLIRRGFDRELMHAINMKIIVYGVCVYRLKINFLKYIRTTVCGAQR